jgi:ribose 5-phosphate isomerase A
MDLKRQAACRALTYVRDGMVLGLGSGSTTAYFIELLAGRLRGGVLRDILGVPTSEATADRARALGIPLTTLADHSCLDLAVDGADEVDPDLNLVKGLGGALLREKIVATQAERFVIVVDESKLVPRLGTRAPLPIEVVPFGAELHVRWLDDLGWHAELRHESDGSLVVTDNGNYLIHCWFRDGVSDPYALARLLADRPGIVEHGLFLKVATRVIVAERNGVRVLRRESREGKA